MRPKIHPEFHKVNVSCACGNNFGSFSTSKELKVEVCSACHPFFTGTQRLLDTAGRVERFNTMMTAQKKAAADKEAKTKKPVRVAEPKPAEPKPATA